MFEISKKLKSIQGVLNISGSKSESNRLLTLRSFTTNFKIDNLSDSDDTKVLISAIKSNSKKVDISHAGTAMRFLTSYFSSIEENKQEKIINIYAHLFIIINSSLDNFNSPIWIITS